MNRYLGSSVNPDKLGMTVKGILVGLIPAAVLISKMMGADIPLTQWNDIMNAIVALVISVAGVASGGMVLFGLVRKVWVKFKK